MNQAKQIQQLSADDVAIKEIVRRTGVSRKTVRKYLRKLQAIEGSVHIDVSTPLPDNQLAAMILGYVHNGSLEGMEANAVYFLPKKPPSLCTKNSEAARINPF